MDRDLNVSILVLLDMALMRDHPDRFETDTLVSILVLLDMALMLRGVKAGEIWCPMFQSLFYWIWL